MRFLVTAGSTREAIDRVRDWGNIFTGNTGYSIARAIAEVGAVDLLTSNQTHMAELQKGSVKPNAIVGQGFSSHAELKALLERAMRERKYDAVFMSAAVSDYRPTGSYQVLKRDVQSDGSEMWLVRDVQAPKVKSHFGEIAFMGTRTEKLVDLFRNEWNYKGLLIKFKLEVDISREKLIDIGQRSRRASGADYLVANTLEMVTGENAGAFLLSDAGEEWIARHDLPARMKQLVANLVK